MRTLEEKFEKAFKRASAIKEKLPPDIMLQFYGYYKQATKGKNYSRPSGDSELRNAFKLNAWFQLNNLTEDEAKKKYIELVEKITKKKIK